ncbi:structural maintenance of chromosomes protein 5-like [Acanthaster planci]|uniref:Structural maintenance of chromosomes protein 5 n=1 Tax=Acanthaster planci TaxID=133434 RepID=A0A8B7YHZ4_ACAPL|nr:structural maintenance of chromosomes protein 5-like [Acanthaster planci]
MASKSRKREADLHQIPGRNVNRNDVVMVNGVSGKSSRKPGTSKSFVEGSVVRILMENFVTYDKCEFRPGPHLNVIMGPNGTGKSTVVCAMCLGLAGSTSLLGRAKEVGEFVKHGSNEAIIELELYKDPKNVIIRRVITKQGNRTTWFLNGSRCHMRDVQDKVKSLNIQISNLCQFLPQDKVVEFANMSNVELLENTEKAVGSPELFDQHCRLKNFRNEQKEMLLQHQEMSHHLEKLTEKNSRLEADVKRYQERQHHLEVIETLEKKKAWVEYDTKRKMYVDLKKRQEALKTELREAQAVNAPIQQKLDTLTAKLQELDTVSKEMTNEARQLANAANKKHEKIDEFSSDLTEIQDELRVKQQDEEKRQAKIRGHLSLVEGWQKELEQIPPVEDIKPQLDQNAASLRAIVREVSGIDTEYNGIKTERESLQREKRDLELRLRRLNDQKDMRLGELQKYYRDTYNAVEWLRSNQDMFKHKIHEPVALVINVPNKEHAKYIEHAIPTNDMLAFVCEDADDMELFVSLVREKQNLRINVVKSPGDPLSSFKPQKSIDDVKRWGFNHYLRDLIEAPEAVMVYLCKMHKLHNVPLGSRVTQDSIDKVVKESGVTRFYTPDHNYIVRRSRYGNHQQSTDSNFVADARLLNISVDMSAKRELEQNIQEIEHQLGVGQQRYKELQQRRQVLMTQDNELKEQKKGLIQKRDRHKTILQNIAAKREAIRKCEASAIDVEAEMAKASKKIKAINEKKLKLVKEFSQLIKDCIERTKEKVELGMKYAVIFNQKTHIEATQREASANLQRLENEKIELLTILRNTKDVARQLIRRAQELTGSEEPSTELREAFSTCPDDLDEIEQKIHYVQAQADCLFETDQRVVQEFEHRKVEIQSLTEKVERSQQQMDRKLSEIDDMKQHWKEDLNGLIADINQQFSNFFEAMGCAGEVKLQYDSEEDYDKYGISIQVKFRKSEQMRELTSHYQSGGERSVSTILYLMALQELNKCPFRVVDEINQGMDPNNERRVFELVVKTACRENTSQYFLITPKLLLNLSYGPKMTVICVYNGHWIMPYSHWNLEAFCRRRRRLLVQ